MPNRIELSESLKGTSRRPIDAEWSKPKKIAFASVAGTIAVAGLAWGIVSFIQSRPPSMPTTPQEAVLALASNNFDRLDGERQEAIRSQAVRLLAEAPEETRRELRESIELSEEGRQQLREAFMEDMVRKFARGEGNPWEAMRGGPGGPRPQGERTGEGRPGGGERNGEGGRPGGGQGGPGGGGGEGEEGPSRAERQAEFRSRIQERMASGNSQTMALMGEFFSSMRKQREAAGNNGGGGRRGGGGG